MYLLYNYAVNYIFMYFICYEINETLQTLIELLIFSSGKLKASSSTHISNE